MKTSLLLLGGLGLGALILLSKSEPQIYGGNSGSGGFTIIPDGNISASSDTPVTPSLTYNISDLFGNDTPVNTGFPSGNETTTKKEQAVNTPITSFSSDLSGVYSSPSGLMSVDLSKGGSAPANSIRLFSPTATKKVSVPATSNTFNIPIKQNVFSKYF